MPSACSAAGIPSASQAQFANHERLAASTRCGVSTVENGFSIRISVVPGWSTSACASWSRRYASATSSGTRSSALAISDGTGALPVRTKDE